MATGDKITLDAIISEANALEIVSRQMGEFSSSKGLTQELNKLSSLKTRTDFRNCRLCGGRNHTAWDKKCPAIGKDCRKCGLKGHFEKYCRTRPLKLKRTNTGSTKMNKMKKSRSESKPDEEVDYIFH